jgi:hypothetical protein
VNYVAECMKTVFYLGNIYSEEAGGGHGQTQHHRRRLQESPRRPCGPSSAYFAKIIPGRTTFSALVAEFYSPWRRRRKRRVNGETSQEADDM